MTNKKKIPISKPYISNLELQYVNDSMQSGWVSSKGKYIDTFEKLFAKFCGSSYAISTSNGTSALHLALIASGIQSDDEVIVPSLTFIATANAVRYVGATPVFVDSEPVTWNIDPLKIEAAITPKTKAIIPVHLYGHPANMYYILQIAAKYNLIVIEDAAEAHGAKYKNKVVGSIGDLGVFSFYGNKIITTGEGGMVVTDNKNYADKIKLLRDHGMSESRKYWHPILGYNYRLTNIQAAIGVGQMENIEYIIQSKLAIALDYENRLKNCTGITLPPNRKWANNMYWLFTILVEKNYKYSYSLLIDKLSSEEIETRPFFPPVHTQPIYNTGQKLPIAESLYSKGLCLPSFVGLSPTNISHITDIIN